ncbi:MAG: hypothetical protein AB7E95_11430 [Kiritimatiellales bacterium]
MRKIPHIILLIIFSGICAHAVLIASDSFSTGNDTGDYVDNTNLGAAGNVTVGTVGFLSTSWAGSTGTIKTYSSYGLTHAWVQGNSANGAVKVIPGINSTERISIRNLDTVLSGSTFYISGLLTMSGALTALDNDESIAMGLAAADMPGNTFDTTSGLKIGLTKDASGTVYLAAFTAGNTYTLGSGLSSAQAAETQMIVCRMDINETGNDTLTAWIAQEGDARLTQVLKIDTIDMGTASDFASFVVQGRGAAETHYAGGVMVDEFRFGTTWWDVTSAPVLKLLVIQ